MLSLLLFPLHPPPVISFLQFAFALSEQLSVHSPSLPLFFSIFHSRVFYLPLPSPYISSSLTLAVLILSHRHFVSFMSLRCTCMFLLSFSLNWIHYNWIPDGFSSNWLAHGERLRFSPVAGVSRDTQLYLICVPRDSARFIEPLTLMDSSGHFIHCRFIRGILNR